MTGRTTRADRLAHPTTRDAVRAVAEAHGACLHPVQLRRINTETSEIEQVLIPCGATLASKCPPCAERAKVLRAAQCQEGWHLETEPITGPPPPDEVQAMWVEHRAQAQAWRDDSGAAGDDTAELDELIAELDQEIANSGLRGKADPARARPRRHRSTRRRQDAPDLPKRKISPRTIGKTYTTPGGKVFRPSMFLTLTCPSYGRVGEDGTPLTRPPTATRGRRGTRCISPRCSTGSPRTCGAWWATTCSTSPPSNLSGAWLRMCTSPCAAPSPAPSCGSSWPPPTTRSGGPPQTPCASLATTCQCGTRPAAVISTPLPASCCPPGTRPSTASAQTMIRCMWLGSGPGSTPRACSPGPRTPPGVSGYLTKYLTKQLGDCHQPDTDAQRAHVERLTDALRYEPCSPTCANWLRYGIQPKNPRPGLVPGACKGKGHRYDHLGYAGRRVLVSRKWSGKTLADHRGDRQAWLTEMLGLPASDPARYRWEQVQPDDEDCLPPGRRLLRSVADRLQWEQALAEARHRAREALAAEVSATGRAA